MKKRDPYNFEKLHASCSASGNQAVAEIESKQILAHYNIPVPQGRCAATVEQAHEIASLLSFPVVCKAVANVVHKTEIGGIATNIKNHNELNDVFIAMDSSIRKKNIPHYRGILIEEQCSGAIEVIAGYAHDEVFGPTVMLGLGGIYTDLFKDVVFHCAPVSSDDVVTMLSKLASYPLFCGYRNLPKIEVEPLIEFFMNFNRLIGDGSRFIQSIDCNPILVDENSISVVDASFVFFKEPLPNPFYTPAADTKHIKTFFAPQSCAVVGASATAHKIGNVIVDTLIHAGFKGTIYPIHPHHEEVLGLKAHASIAQIPSPPDVVIIAVDLKMVPEILDAMHAKGSHNAIIISGGGKELGGERGQLEKEIMEKAAHYGIRIIGPNCIGVFDAYTRFDSFFYHRDRFVRPPEGAISFMTQSGTWGVAFMELAQTVGLSKMISYGNRIDVDEADLIAYLCDDAGTRVIGSYIEGLENGKKYINAIADAKKKHKPVVVYKTGRNQIAADAAVSHTGAYGGSYSVYHDLLTDAGAILTDSLHDCFSACMALSMQPPAKGNRTALVSNGAGPMVNALDIFPQKNLSLAVLSDTTKQTMRSHFSFFYIVDNPVDITGSATSKDYDFALEQLINDDGVDIIMPFFVFQNTPLDEAIIDVMRKHSKTQRKPLICCCTNGVYSDVMKERLIQAGLPVFNSVGNWVAASYAVMQWGTLMAQEA